MKRLVETTRYFVKCYLHSKRFYILLLTPLVVLSAISIVDAVYGVHNSVNDYLSSTVAIFTGLLYPILFALFAGDLVAEEFEKSKAYFVYVLPLQRKLVYFSKALAAILIAFTVVSLYNIVAVVFALTYYKSVVSSLALSYVLQLLYAGAWLFLSAAIGSISRNSRNAIIIAALFNFFILNTLGSVIAKTGIQPWSILNYMYYPIYTILSNSSISSVTFASSIGEVTIQVPPIEYLVLVSSAYILVCLTICYLLYTRREVR